MMLVVSSSAESLAVINNSTSLCSFCCSITSGVIGRSIGYNLPLSHAIISAVALAEVAFLLVFLRYAESDVFAVYLNGLTSLAALFVLLSLKNLLPLPFTPTATMAIMSMSSVADYSHNYTLFLNIMRGIFIAFQWILQTSTVFFLFEVSPTGAAIARSFLRSLVVCLPLLIVWTLGAVLSFPVAAEVTTELALVAFYIVSLTMAKTQCVGVVARPALWVWAFYQLFLHSVFALLTALRFDTSSTVAVCINAMWNWFYYAALGPAFAYVCAKDTRYWRQRGALLQALRNVVHGQEVTDESRAHLEEGKTPYIWWDSLELLERIGGGGYADVYSGRWKGASVAIKSLRIEKGQDTAMEELLKESAVMCKLGLHENIVRLFGISVRGKSLKSIDQFHEELAHREMVVCLVMELLSGGSLWSLIHDRPHMLTPAVALSIAGDIAQGMAHMHAQGVLHRDLKSSNVLLDNKLHAKLCDFGVSRVIDINKSATLTMAGTFQWMPPEVLRGERYTLSSDVYAFGVVLWELFEKRKPFEDLGAMAVAYEGATLSLTKSDIPEGVAELIADCLAPKDERPSFSAVCESLQFIRQNLTGSFEVL